MSGLGAGSVRAAGGSPTQELIASLLAPLAPAAGKAVIAPAKMLASKASAALATTPARQEAVAARIINEALPDTAKADVERALAEALRRSGSDPLVQYKSPAELSKSIPLAAFEKDLSRALPEARIAVAENMYGEGGREAARLQLIRALTPEANQIMPETQRGEELRSILQRQFAGAKKSGGALYNQAKAEAADTLIDLVPAEQQAKQLYPEFFKAGYSAEPSAELQGIISALAGKTATQPEVNALSSRITSAIRNAPRVGSGDIQNERAYLTAVKGVLRKVETEGLSDTEAGRTLLEARKEWTQLKDLYEKGAVGEILGTKKNQDVKVVSEKIAKRIFASPTATKKFIDAAGKDEQALSLLKGHAVNELTKNAQGQKWVNYIKAHDEQIKALFGEDAKAFKQVAKDILSEQWVNKAAYAASRGQSATAQVNSIREAKTNLLRIIGSGRFPTIAGGGIGAAAGGFSPMGLVTGAAGAAAGAAIERTAANAEQGINQILLKASMNPQTLKAMVSKPSPETLGQIYRAIASNAANSEVAAIATGLAKSVGGDSSPDDIGMRDATGQTYLTPQALKREQSMTIEPTKALEAPREKIKAAFIEKESSGNPNAVSKATIPAKGLFQFKDATGKAVLRQLGLNEEYDPFNPEQQEKLFWAHLDELKGKYNNDQRLAIAAYNLGEPNLNAFLKGKTKSWEAIKDNPKLPTETKNYVEFILNRLKG
jgi:hypothetical protein